MTSVYHPKRKCGRGCGREVSARHLARHEVWCFFPRTIERLHELGKVERVGDCLIWDSLRRNIDNGYGRVGPGEKLAHVIAFELAGGVLPPRHVVMHSCDVKGCIEPTHLSAGTQGQNLREAFQRGLNVMGNDRLSRQAATFKARYAADPARQARTRERALAQPLVPCQHCARMVMRGAPLTAHERKCARGGAPLHRTERFIDPAKIVHGTVKGYTHGKCRCEPCRLAKSAQHAAYKARE